MRRALTAFTLSLLALGGGLDAGDAEACLWDTDTLRKEAEGLPSTMKVIAGSFERNPPLYYEMRLERAARRIAEDPGDLEAYDDAGVACDRLGRDDGALAYMEGKRKAMERMAAALAGGAEGPAGRTGAAKRLETHRYRYLANLGTFQVHAWLRGGADRARIDDARRAAANIRSAIRLNPDAHFGRERYQLRAMEWIVDAVPYERGEGRTPNRLGDFLGLTGHKGLHNEEDEGDLEKLGIKDAVEGLSGMIVLGNAWESVDVFHALRLALQVEGRSSVAYLAELRLAEIIDSGKRSVRPGAPAGKELSGITLPRHHLIMKEVKKGLRDAYTKARAQSEEWQERRTEYMLERLRRGEHPDTHPRFWSGFRN